MGRLYLPNEREIIGPWLLGTNELEKLDVLLNSIHQKLTTSFEKQIEFEASNAVRLERYKSFEDALTKIKTLWRNEQDYKRITITSHDGRTMVDETIANILIDPSLQSFRPTDLDIKVQVGADNKFSLSITDQKDGYLDYKIKCYDDDIENEVRYLVENWIDVHQGHKVKQLWNKYSGAIGFFAFWPFLFYSLSITGDPTNYKELYKQQMSEVLEKGLNENSQSRALELLIKYSIDYRPPVSSLYSGINRSAIKIAAISFLFLLMAIIYPKTVLGIGQYKFRLQFYKAYTTFFAFTIPSVFIIAPAYEWIKFLLY